MPASGAAQVALDVDGQGLERGDVQDPAAQHRVVGRTPAAIRSSDHRNAASVLPEPVGATTRASRPRWTASHAPVCAAVGAAKAPSNHARVAGVNARERVGGHRRAILPRSSDTWLPGHGLAGDRVAAVRG